MTDPLLYIYGYQLGFKRGFGIGLLIAVGSVLVTIGVILE